MDFTIKTNNESEFNEVLQNIVEEYQISPPTSMSINRDSSTGLSIISLTGQFIERLNNVNAELVKKLQNVR